MPTINFETSGAALSYGSFAAVLENTNTMKMSFLDNSNTMATDMLDENQRMAEAHCSATKDSADGMRADAISGFVSAGLSGASLLYGLKASSDSMNQAESLANEAKDAEDQASALKDPNTNIELKAVNDDEQAEIGSGGLNKSDEALETKESVAKTKKDLLEKAQVKRKQSDQFNKQADHTIQTSNQLGQTLSNLASSTGKMVQAGYKDQEADDENLSQDYAGFNSLWDKQYQLEQSVISQTESSRANAMQVQAAVLSSLRA